MASRVRERVGHLDIRIMRENEISNSRRFGLRIRRRHSSAPPIASPRPLVVGALAEATWSRNCRNGTMGFKNGLLC